MNQFTRFQSMKTYTNITETNEDNTDPHGKIPECRCRCLRQPSNFQQMHVEALPSGYARYLLHVSANITRCGHVYLYVKP